MVYLKFEKLSNVSNFICIRNKIIYENIDKQLINKDSTVIIDDIDDFFQFSHYVLMNVKNVLVALNTKTKSLKFIENRVVINIENREENYCFLMTDLTYKKLFIGNIDDFSGGKLLIKDYNWEFVFLSSQKTIFTQSSTFIKNINVDSSIVQWVKNYNFSTPLNDVIIRNIIGHWEQYLLLKLSDYSIVSVDSNTGDILWHYSAEQLTETIFPNTKNVTIDLIGSGKMEEGKIFLLRGGTFFSFDIATQTANYLWQSSGEYDEINIVKSVYYGDYIYFTACYDRFPSSPNWIGIFNRKIYRIEWMHEGKDLPLYGGYRGSYQDIQVDDDGNIYALDNSGGYFGTLHIFAREAPNN